MQAWARQMSSLDRCGVFGRTSRSTTWYELDYLLHAAEGRLSLKQVEFNAISSSLLGSLSERVAVMHRHITSLHLHHAIHTYLHRHI
ncbi:hypothetical protein M405DRAFT_778789 [Rhizopogon salebrosus TDB-379]|nr:hypothetical protein M405DRAFT_778789 [Rhizopogon salebrosus TDB-379]